MWRESSQNLPIRVGPWRWSLQGILSRCRCSYCLLSSGEINASARLIPEIEVGLDGSYSLPETSALSHDVTGGMLGKLQSGRDIALRGIPVFLTKAGSDEMLQICTGTK